MEYFLSPSPEHRPEPNPAKCLEGAVRQASAPPPIWVGRSNERTVRFLSDWPGPLAYSAHLSVPGLKRLQEAFPDERDQLGGALLAAPMVKQR
jgi:hypothetical protein